MYPFRPKSTAYLKAGQYWTFELKDGTYVCDIVIALRCKNGETDKRSFLAGLLDWSGNHIPHPQEIKGKPLKEFGYAHIKAITENGGEIRGEIGPSWGFKNCIEYTDTITTWGYGVIRVYGEKYFGTKVVS
jgi:hypothetical protein